jgi:hypothetical protein
VALAGAAVAADEGVAAGAAAGAASSAASGAASGAAAGAASGAASGAAAAAAEQAVAECRAQLEQERAAQQQVLQAEWRVHTALTQSRPLLGPLELLRPHSPSRSPLPLLRDKVEAAKRELLEAKKAALASLPVPTIQWSNNVGSLWDAAVKRHTPPWLGRGTYGKVLAITLDNCVEVAAKRSA